MKKKLNLFIVELKETFSIKKIFKELFTLHLQEYFLLFLMIIAQVATFLFIKNSSLLTLILSISSIINLILVDRGRITNFFGEA